MVPSGGPKWRPVLLVLFFSALPILTVNQYRFGIGNHSIVIPFIRQSLDPGLYPGDYMMAERGHLLTFFWPAVAFLARHLPISLPVIFFGLYAAATTGAVAGTWRIARRLFGREDVAVLSCFFFMFSFPPLGMRSVFPNYLDVVLVAWPFVLFAVDAALARRTKFAFALLGVAFLLHPLSAIYGAGVVLAMSLAGIRHVGAQRLAGALALMAAIMLPSFVWRATTAPASLHLVGTDPGWLSLLRLRSPYHVFPSSWSAGQYAGVALLAASWLASWRHRPSATHHRLIVAGVLGIVAMWIAGTVFVEWWPVAIVVQSQLFRSSDLLLTIASIYCASFLLRELEIAASPWRAVLAALPAVGVLYGARGGLVAWAGLVGLAAVVSVGRRLRPAWIDRGGGAPALVLLLSVGLGAGAYALSGGFRIGNSDVPDWVDVQRWARRSTDRADLFIVPLQAGASGFRLESERSIYGDWKDGTEMFWNPAFGEVWHRRMLAIGYRDGDAIDGPEWRRRYEGLSEAEFEAIAAGAGPADGHTLLVMFAGRPALAFPERYRNGTFAVYQVR